MITNCVWVPSEQVERRLHNYNLLKCKATEYTWKEKEFDFLKFLTIYFYCICLGTNLFHVLNFKLNKKLKKVLNSIFLYLWKPGR